MTWDTDRLRDALSGGNGGIATLLADHPDPTVRLISEIWAHRAQSEPPEPEAEPTAASEHPPTGQRVFRRIARLEQELKHIGDFTDALAAALGACSRCWGNDSVCPRCTGLGAPGYGVPDRALFSRFIAPAVHRLAEARRERLAAASSTQPAPINDGATVTERSQS